MIKISEFNYMDVVLEYIEERKDYLDIYLLFSFLYFHFYILYFYFIFI